ncbi:catalase-related domain-containing protein [Rhodococcus sp. 24CO]|uniref:catalase-related domain-containing protein n=1 Tax=Rhodococcus sp. 24CO TaxID=3117460 RepID=UPI003D33A32B
MASYPSNALDGGCLLLASADCAVCIEVPEVVLGRKVRQAPATFDDHFSQACLFYRSLSPIEQVHVAEAYTFELGNAS